jgi:hypothetical protein
MAKLRKKKPTQLEISNCALKCGQILGLLIDLDEAALEALIEDRDFSYKGDLKTIQRFKKELEPKI